MFILVRHAEKPGTVQVESRDDGVHLSARGRGRARALGEQLPDIIGVSHDKIDYIFATAKSKASERPLETIDPLAKICGKKIKSKYKDDEYHLLAEQLKKQKYANKNIVICWHHGKLPHLIHALGGSTSVIPMVNDKWDENCFDRIVTISSDGTTKSIPQRLMFGDTEK